VLRVEYEIIVSECVIFKEFHVAESVV